MHTLRLLWAAYNEETWLRRQNRLKRRARQHVDFIEEMSASEFISRFRLDKSTFMRLCRDLRRFTSLRGTVEVSVETKVLCALSFFANGSNQKVVGVSQNLNQRTVSRCIRQVIDALNEDQFIDKWISFPQSQERMEIKLAFESQYGLPGVRGCIDCTHVPIVKPNDEEHLFRNRKGYHSLNVQMVCDHNLCIRNVNAKFGGSIHDHTIWSASRVDSYMRQLNQSGEQGWLLGDCAYPQLPWLMTPSLNAVQGSKEEIYSQIHSQARSCIEHCFGLLKTRWQCLVNINKPLHYHPIVAAKIIIACCVLHNIALKEKVMVPSSPVVIEEVEECVCPDPDDYDTHNDVIEGRAVLNMLLQRF